ncbi:hypothetical protein MTHERMOG20_23390 [Moorella thermoacetica]|uniref:Uncharacterized protein n=2 Tax=Neomoorella thermoacetica TaxID=1525 RepID=A0A1J5N6G1_NEOTH|nr:hypothetical protein [Moorella thermoacetica]AKX95727.1 hypothetical protein MOTHA_c03580 [Moorella thermoacetica]OIQ08717.1 hypothetical protein MOOR_16360 [Moorella thermoacetica]OIQ54561.1 hypothetical protein MOCA_22300 [Moorella thermoacetica]QCZ99537.1 hypothetical protein MothHH_00367 [Moorella thermoacetica]TYL07196.1 hypothetical protein MOOCA_23040 [Moorella thermoacetica]
MLKGIVEFLKGEKGAVTTTELIGYSLLVGGAVALVGFGATALFRGKTGAIFGAVKNMKAMSGAVSDTSTYSATLTTDTNTGIATGATGN